MTEPLTLKLVDQIRAGQLPELNGKTDVRFWDETQDGLCLRIRKRGDSVSKFYEVHYGKQKMQLGSITDYTLADVQHRAYEIRRDVKDGIDPKEKRRPKPVLTLKVAATQYVDYLGTRGVTVRAARQSGPGLPRGGLR